MSSHALLIGLLGPVLLTASRGGGDAARVWLKCRATGDEVHIDAPGGGRPAIPLSETRIFLFDKSKNEMSEFADGRVIPNDTSLTTDPSEIRQNSSSVQKDTIMFHAIRSTYHDGGGQPYRDTTDEQYTVDRATLRLRIDLTRSTGSEIFHGAAEGSCQTITAPPLSRNVF